MATENEVRGEGPADTEPRAQYRDAERAAGFTTVSNVLARHVLRVSDGALVTYLAIKSFAGEKPEAFAGQKTLAEVRGISEQAVRKHLRELEGASLISTKRRGQGRTAILVVENIPADACQSYLKRWRGDQTVSAQTATQIAVKTATRDAVPRRQEEHRKKRTDRVPAAASATPRPTVAAEGSVSDDLRTWAEATATALGRPGEAKQLATWARKHEVPLGVLEAAAEVTAQQAGLEKPVAYLQTVAKVMVADRAAAAEAGERKRADRKRDALGYARQVYADPIIGGSWASVESIVGESYGLEIAVQVVRELRE